MKATTIKLEGKILQEIDEIRPPATSLTAFVKGVLHSEYQRRKMRAAALEYSKFLSASESEAEFLREWEEADLDRPVRRTRK
ncbi:MAG: hypothetical protein HYW49_05505 [Deltaproteobacteria bacterium]|nr:hypothetical protein [Deltaproteobacteria bacterium]